MLKEFRYYFRFSTWLVPTFDTYLTMIMISLVWIKIKVNLPASINGCALSRSGKLLLTALGGTSGGTCGSVVGVRLPLTAPPQIVSTPGHNAPISRVMMNHEETLLFTGGEDGLVMVWQVSDREGKILLNLSLILTLRRSLRRKLRMRWFFDISKAKESGFF